MGILTIQTQETFSMFGLEGQMAKGTYMMGSQVGMKEAQA